MHKRLERAARAEVQVVGGAESGNASNHGNLTALQLLQCLACSAPFILF